MDEAKTQLTVSLSASQAESVDRIAAVTGHERDWVIQRALSQYLRGEGADILADAHGMAQLAEGQGVGLDQVLLKAEAIIRRVEAHRTSKAS